MEAGARKHIVILASGGGSNARTICEHFADSAFAQVSGLLTNNASSGVFAFARRYGVPAMLMTPPQYNSGEWLIRAMAFLQADLIVLAGYMKLIPAGLVQAYPDRIVNIHPSLLPDHGGKGMFGMHVHESVVARGDKVSGITIHFVNEIYDQGKIIRQERLSVDPAWDARTLQQEVLKLEHYWYPREIEALCQRLQADSPSTH